MPVPAYDSAHKAEAIAKLTQAFRNKANIVALLGVYASAFQDIEAVFWGVINSRILDNTPTGDQLDQLGPLVGEPLRLGRSDAAYLTAIKLRIRVNRSQGKAEDVIQVAQLMFPASTYTEFPPYKWLVEAYGLSDPLTFKRLLASTKAVGSRGVVHYSTWSPTLNLTLSSRYGGATAPLGLSSRYGGATNVGLLVAAVGVDKS